MKKITDYTIIEGLLAADLEVQVKSKIAEGWLPLGGAFVHADKYAQTLVKYETAEELFDKAKEYIKRKI